MAESMAYVLLESEKLPEQTEKKPKLSTCIALAVALLLMIASSIAVGIGIGYAYCYIEHRTGMRAGNISAPMNHLQIVRLSRKDSNATLGNKTINGAIMSSYLVSRILTLGHALLEEDISFLPWASGRRDKMI